MNLEHLLEALSLQSERNGALRFLESVVVDTDERLVGLLAGMISEPASIEDTHSFALLIADLGAESFITPLIESISGATPARSVWLADYMYALGSLLMEREELYGAEESFVHLLGNWLLSTGGGEISWKAGYIMAELQHPGTREYLLRGAADKNLFHQTRIACIRGIMNQYPEEATPVLERLASDSDDYVREAVCDARESLNRRRRHNRALQATAKSGPRRSARSLCSESGDDQ